MKTGIQTRLWIPAYAGETIFPRSGLNPFPGQAPDAGTTTMAYDSAGRLVSVTDPLTHVTVFTDFDAADPRPPPALIAVFALHPVWYPSFLPAMLPLLLMLSSLIVATLTLMIGGVPAALYERFSSRGEADFADKLLSAMRYQFGGHVEKHTAS